MGLSGFTAGLEGLGGEVMTGSGLPFLSEHEKAATRVCVPALSCLEFLPQLLGAKEGMQFSTHRQVLVFLGRRGIHCTVGNLLNFLFFQRKRKTLILI